MERSWEDLTLKSLRKIVKEQGFTKYSHLNKQELIRFLRKKLRKRGVSEREIQTLLKSKPLSSKSPARRKTIIPEPVEEEEVQEYAMTLLNLPTEVILELMDRMDEDLLASVCLTHRRFYDLCQRRSIQRKLKQRIPSYREAWKKIQEVQRSGTTSLDLSHMSLKEVPLEIGTLASLQKLNLSENQLTTLPPEIGSLSSLQELNLFNNRLTTLPPEIGNLSSLQILLLNSNQLTTIPPEITTLSSLQILDLSDNRLRILPPEIGALSSLQELSLSFNRLTTLPPEIGALSFLKTLFLFNNQLTTLPLEIGALSSLRQLGLAHNQLTTLPRELGLLPNLRGIYIKDNFLGIEDILPELEGIIRDIPKPHLSSFL